MEVRSVKDIRTPLGKWQFNHGVIAGGYRRENCGSARPTQSSKMQQPSIQMQQPFSVHTTSTAVGVDAYHGLDNHVAARATLY